jgi:hypothetical protein
VPISAVFIALFIASAALNMTIFQRNRKRGHKFVLSALLFGFSMARITANVLRLAWATHLENVRLAIAAGIFASAGVLLLFVVNLIFLQRLLRAHHPAFGWARPLSLAFKFLYVCVVACLIMVIVSTVYGFYTLDQDVQLILRKIRLVAVVYLALLAFLPIPATLLCIAIPPRGDIDHFGTGSMRTKVILLLFTSTLLAFGASWRAASAFIVRPATNPGWWNHKAVFYCVNYVIELIVVFTYALARFDLRFHIPNGSHAPGHYTNGVPGAEKSFQGSLQTPGDEETLQGDVPPTAEQEQQREKVWENKLQDELAQRGAAA